MEGLLFHGGALAAREGHLPRGWILVEGERIAALGAGDPPAAPGARRVDLAGRVLAPGLIDLHAHGALGYDTMDATPTALREMARFYARHGVTGYLAATVTAPLDEILVALENVAGVMAEGTGGARLLGAHVEGPYLDRARLGAQDPRHVRPPAPEEYAALLREGVTRLLTLAPEAPGAAGLIAEAHRRGSSSPPGTRGRRTRDGGGRGVGPPPRDAPVQRHGALHHRSPGVGRALTLPALTCELIADGVHVHPAALALAVRAKGVAGIVLVTDAMRGAGMPDGRYALGGLDVIVEGGEARLPAGNLAGSTLTLERAVANIMAATGLALHEALPMATANPARVLGLAGRAGALAPGHDADLAVLGEGLRVDLTVVGGEVVYRAEGAAGGAA